jgi:glycosyltransferase involved in cell wall biosynthesis
MGPKRILYVENDTGSVAGSVRALYRLIEHLDPERYEPWLVLSRDRPSPMLPAFEKLGCRIVRVSREPLTVHAGRLAQGRLGAPIRVCNSLVRELSRAQELAQVIRENRIDLVHANNNLYTSRPAILAAAWCQVPVVCHQRNHFTPSLGSGWHTRLVRESLCISKTVYDTVAERANTKGARIVYDGVEVPDVRPERRPLPADARIAVVGRLTGWKGQDVFIRAAPEVLMRFPQAHFLVVGASEHTPGSRHYEQGLHAMVRDLGLKDRVEFVGHIDDVASFMRDSVDIVVHTSVKPEPFGLVLAEAMAAGKPIVASDSGACPEIVENGRSGLLFTPGDSSSLAQQLLRLLARPDFCDELVAEGWARVSQRFEASRASRQVAAVYDEILGA